jgi:hypothetical protein
MTRIMLALMAACAAPALALAQQWPQPDPYAATPMPGAPMPAYTPWHAVLNDYMRVGYDETSWRNDHGNFWMAWTSHRSGNVLLFSPTVQHGFNCGSSGSTNYWPRCQRYDLWSGHPDGIYAVTIRNGVVDDHR